MSDGRTWGSIIGGVAAYFTGGLSLVATGVAVGGAVGGLLEPKQKTETNRIDDIKVSLSKYGDGIPETWGNNVPSATCVWSTYIIELAEKQSGGKGGGTENTNYRQFIQSMWCLGKSAPEGTPVSIRKAWIDGKLNYDASSGLSPGQALATEENPWVDIALLPGYEDQLPVPMIETYEGVGNVPAFRGRICLFIFGLECPGGRVPQLQFELCIGAEFGSTVTTLVEFDETYLKTVSVADDPSIVRMLYGPGWDLTYANHEVEVWDISLDGSHIVSGRFTASNNSAPAQGHSDETCFVNTGGDGVSSDELHYYNAEGEKRIFVMPVSSVAEHMRYAKKGDYFAVAWHTNITEGPFVYGFESGAFQDMALGSYVAALALTDFYLYIMRNGFVEQWNLEDLSFIKVICTVPGYAVSQSSMHVVSDTEIYISDASNDTILLVQGDQLALKFEDATPIGGIYGGTFHVKGNVLLKNNNNQTEPTLEFVTRGLTTVQADVADFLETQSLRAGLAADQIDVSTIDGTFHGLTVKTPASARAIMAPVLTYGAIGVVEEDGALRFFHRKDHSSVAIIQYEELGFAEDGSEPGDPFPLVRSNSQELPKSLTLTYNDKNFDYQSATVKAFFPSVSVGGEDSTTLDMAMDGGTAQTICRRMLLERWMAQTTRSCAVSRAYAYLSAGDVVTVLSKTGSYGDWVISKATDTGARIEWELFPADTELLIQSVPGPGGFIAQVIEPITPPLRAQILDIPILRDADNNPGLYVALDSYGPGSARGELYVGDDDNSLVSRGTVSDSAPIGFAESPLPAASSGYIDEANLLTVNIGDDVFESVTRDVLLSGGGEYWAYGRPGRWEIGASALGDSLGGGRVILSRHLRGQFGTEQHTGTHLVNDIFVLLRSVGMLRPGMGVGELGLDKYYRAIALGRSLNSAASQVYANTGEGLMPLSPLNLRRTDENDLTVDRRSRLAMNNSTGTLPLGEATEAYSWSFYTSGYAALIGTAITTTATITAAQMTAIGVTPSATLYVRVSQISDSVGKGHELQATA